MADETIRQTSKIQPLQNVPTQVTQYEKPAKVTSFRRFVYANFRGPWRDYGPGGSDVLPSGPHEDPFENVNFSHPASKGQVVVTFDGDYISFDILSAS